MKKQLSYVNYLRFYAIAAVLLLHCLTPYTSNPVYYGTRSWVPVLILNEIGRTGVPIFFMISGFLLLRDSRTTVSAGFYVRRLTRILLPLLCWNAIYAAYYGMGLRDFIAASLNNGCAYHLWFLYTLAGIYLLAPFIKCIVDSVSRRALWLLTVILAFTGTIRPVLNTWGPVYIYLFEPLANGYLVYFLLGYLLGTAERRVKPLYSVLLMAVGVAIGCLWNHSFSSAEALNMAANTGYSLNHFVAASGLFLLFRSSASLDRPRAAKLGAVLSSLTFSVYFVHVMVLGTYTRLKPSLAPLADIGLSFAVTLLVSMVLALAWRQAKCAVQKMRAK